LQNNLNNLNEVLTRRMFDYFFDKEVKRAHRYRLFFSLVLAQPNIRLSSKGINARVKKKEIMNTVTCLISREIRNSDIIGWFDKGKLFIILVETDNHTPVKVGERLIDSIKTYNFGEDKVSLSIGAVCFPTDGVDTQAIIDKAASLLSQARVKGENQILLP